MSERTDTSWMPLWSWHLRNFKSVREADIRFEPLTLVVGPNSVGKSTLIQSILLLVQAAQGEAEGATFPLNGPLVSLGGYEDVRSKLSKERSVSLGGNFVFNDSATPRISGFDPEDYRPLKQFRRTGPALMTGAIDFKISFDRASVEEPGSADVSAIRWSAEFEGDEAPGHLEIEARRRGEGELQEDVERIRVGKLAWPTDEDFALGFGGELRLDPGGDRALYGLGLRAGIPHNVISEWQLGVLAAHVWVETRTQRPIWRGAVGPGPREANEEAGELTPDDQQELLEWAQTAVGDIEAWNRARTTHPISLPDFLQRQGSEIPSRDRSLLRSNAKLLIDEIVRKTELTDRVYVPPQVTIAGPVRGSAIELHRFLSERVVYLGPLREDPRVTYRSTPAGATGYIGTKGEYTASVLHAGRTGDVACPLEDGSMERMKLAQALDYWVSRLDLVDTISTKDLGRLGIQVSVSRGPVTGLDLTSVGVGVSQLLPVVLMCILSPPGSLILLEQPELHLHPAVQQKLGDFLLACSRSGRQLIVETHSEYLVSRLRRRIAKDVSGDIRGHIAIIFAEQKDGESTLRSINVNEFGGIEDWPAGFFDESADESKRIIEAGLEKKLRLTPGGDGIVE